MIRPEKPGDGSAIDRVHQLGFGRQDEAVLVNELRDSGGLAVSLVAEVEGQVIGHIALSPMTFDEYPTLSKGYGLGPIAVLPEHQRMGVGLQLIESGLELCKLIGGEVVVVLGHPGYYPKAGFKQASDFGILCEFDVPAELFMVIELKEGTLANYHGIARYHQAFHEVE